MTSEQIQQAARFFDESRHDEAVTYLTGHLETDPDDIHAWYLAGLCMVYAKQPDMISTCFTHICNWVDKINPDNLPHPQQIQFASLALLQGAQLILIEDIVNDQASRTKSYTRIVTAALRLAREFGMREVLESAQDLYSYIYPNPDKDPETRFIIPPSPFYLQVEPTNNCNLRCRMCPRKQMKRGTGYLSPALWEKALESWKNRLYILNFTNLLLGRPLSFSRPGVVKLFFMGESLLNKELGQLIKMGKEAGCAIGVQTNGTLLKDSAVRNKLLENPPHMLGFSIDGQDEATYNAVRKGSLFSTLKDSLERFYKERQKAGLTDMAVFITTILPEQTPEAEQKAKKFLAPLEPLVNKIEFIPLDSNREVEFFNISGEIKTFSSVDNADSFTCTEPFKKLNVLWDGTVSPCCQDIDGSMNLGSVEEGIDTIWRGPKMVALRKAITSQNLETYPLCRTCYKK